MGRDDRDWKPGEPAQAVRKRLVEHARQRDWILNQARRAGQHGVTVDELSELASRLSKKQVPPNRISGRVSELKDAGRLVETERRRKTRCNRPAAVHCVPEVLNVTVKQLSLF